MLRIALLSNLMAYTIVVCQPLAYLVFMSKAQQGLSAAAYIELRQRINPIMSRRVPVIYVAALVILLVLIGIAASGSSRHVLVTTSIALACLIIDLIFMLRENVPINGVVDGWSTTSYPADWERFRQQWFTTFAYRQVVLLVGYVSLLVGAVYQ